MEIKNVLSYVSQKNWSDDDLEVECTVEAIIDGIKKKTVFFCEDPLTASEKCIKNPLNFDWFEEKTVL